VAYLQPHIGKTGIEEDKESVFGWLRARESMIQYRILKDSEIEWCLSIHVAILEVQNYGDAHILFYQKKRFSRF
jgi:hypothetical protein